MENFGDYGSPEVKENTWWRSEAGGSRKMSHDGLAPSYPESCKKDHQNSLL